MTCGSRSWADQHAPHHWFPRCWLLPCRLLRLPELARPCCCIIIHGCCGFIMPGIPIIGRGFIMFIAACIILQAPSLRPPIMPGMNIMLPGMPMGPRAMPLLAVGSTQPFLTEFSLRERHVDGFACNHLTRHFSHSLGGFLLRLKAHKTETARCTSSVFHYLS